MTINARPRTQIHYNGRVSAKVTLVTEGVACRPDGEYGRTFRASSSRTMTTCKACERAIAGARA